MCKTNSADRFGSIDCSSDLLPPDIEVARTIKRVIDKRIALHESKYPVPLPRITNEEADRLFAEKGTTRAEVISQLKPVIDKIRECDVPCPIFQEIWRETCHSLFGAKTEDIQQ